MVAKEGSAIEEYEPEALKKILEEIDPRNSLQERRGGSQDC